MLKKFLKPIKLPASADFGVLILRAGISCLMLTHGYAKLSGFLDGNRSFADPIGIGEELSYVLTIFAEFVCSILVILGLFTRAALIPLLITMIVVVFIVHGPDPFDKKEQAVSFLITYLTLFFTGPGKFSIDSKLYK
jgi:putative oxidoreductase